MGRVRTIGERLALAAHRRNFGEAVETLAGTGEYHWMAGNFLKYATAQSKFGPMTPVTCRWTRIS